MLFEVEMIINGPLTYVYPNTIETCLTLNHLLFGRQLLSSSNTASTIVTNVTVPWNTTDEENHIINQFWDRWRHEYVVNLREKQRALKLNKSSPKINVNDILLVYDENMSWHFLRITIVTEVLPSRDSEMRVAVVRTARTNKILKHLINKIFPIENTYEDTNQTYKTRVQKLRQEAVVSDLRSETKGSWFESGY